MKLILCLDDHNGYSFNRRRQTRDRNVRRHFIAVVGDRNEMIYVNSYTRRSFVSDELFAPCIADEGDEFLCKAQEEGAWAFSENRDVSSFINDVDEMLIYRWNRTYPRDICFPQEEFDSFTVVSKVPVYANSHENVECLHYIRRENEK